MLLTVPLLQLELPLVYFDQSCIHLGEAEVAKVLAEGIYRFFCEYRLDGEEAVAQHDSWDHILKVEGQCFLPLLGELIFKVTVVVHEDGKQMFQSFFLKCVGTRHSFSREFRVNCVTAVKASWLL